MLQQQFELAFKRATPLIAVRTQNWQGTSAKLAETLREGEPVPVVLWNFNQGVAPYNVKGQEIISVFRDEGEDNTKANPVRFLDKMLGVSTPTICFFVLPKDLINGDQADAGTLQGISNLRDPLKAVGASLVILAPDISLPAFLQQDVTVFNDSLPEEDVLKVAVLEAYKNWETPPPDERTLLRAIDSLRGLSDFAAEQAVYMSMTKIGLNLDVLWGQKRALINQTPGLNVYEKKEKLNFKHAAKLESIKEYMTDIFTGRKAPRCIVWIDEIGRAIAGADGDRSGTTSDQVGVLLTEMQENDYPGMIFTGPPGTGKSYMPQISGNEFNVPVLEWDFGAAKGNGLVGQAEKAIRAVCRVVKAVSGGDALFIATCNSTANLPPELRRRFKLGTYFFDLYGVEDQKPIWDIYLSKYGLEGPVPTNTEGWTSKEIANCCELAWRLNKPIMNVAKRITPVVTSEVLEKYRREANSRYQDANNEGVYRYIETAKLQGSGRAVAAWEKESK